MKTEKVPLFYDAFKKSVQLFVLLMLVAYAFFSLTFSDSFLTVFGFDVAIVQTSSMTPTIKRYDLVVFTLPKQDLDAGDIAVFYDDSGKHLIIHRILSVEQENGQLFFVTKGDNNPYRDAGRRSENDIVAIYAFTIPFLGLFITFLKVPIGLTALFLNFITIVAVLLLYANEKQSYPQKYYNDQ